MAKQILFLATADGFYGAARVAKGQKFTAPSTFKAKWATPADGITLGEVEEIENPIAAYLAQNAKSVIAGLADKSVAELRQLLDAEQGNQAPRSSVTAKLVDAIANAEANTDDKSGEGAGDDDLLS